MKPPDLQPSFLKIIYLVVYGVLFFFIVLIPKLITSPVNITEKFILEEELIEGSLLGILLLVSILLLNLYKNESARQKELIKKIREDKKSAEERLADSFKYIGQVNVQLGQINSIFNSLNKFPETKNDFKKTLLFFSSRILGIVNADWVLFRIIECNTQKTISEQFEARPGFDLKYPHISNKKVIENQSGPAFSAVISNRSYLNILTCCVLPTDKLGNDERIFIQAITNELAMMFVIFSSAHYKNKDNATLGNDHT